MSLKIMQGDQYAIVFTGTQDGEPLDLSKIEMIEFIVGKLRKVYPGEVTTDTDGNFLFPLTQEETFQFKSASQAIQTGTELQIILRMRCRTDSSTWASRRSTPSRWRRAWPSRG